MPDKSNDTGSRIKSATRSSFVRRTPDKHHFGTPEEIAARVGGSIPTHTDNVPTNFRQIGPDGSSANPNSRTPTRVSGNQKYGNPRRYTG